MRPQEPPRTLLWRLPKWANERFEQALHALAQLSHDDPQSYAIKDEIRSLPGFPRDARDIDVIRRQITTTVN